jgi:hydroxypyruvate reductase/glycerate 2-kinase
MIIKNKNEIAITKLRKQVLDVVEYGIKQVLPYKLMKDALKYNSARKVLKIKNDVYKITGRIFVVGGGKASSAMAEELEKIIGAENIEAGIINCDTSDYKTKKIKIIKAGHPIPNANSVKGVKQMLDFKRKYSIQKNDLVICLVSGGGSALMCYPVQGISLADKQKATDLLLRTGAGINEINLVRKCLSEIKAGGFTRFFAPTRVVGLIISDVVGNELDTVASGPSCLCSLNFQKAYKVLEKYNLLSDAPKSVVKFLKEKCKNENQKKIKVLSNCRNYIIGNNKTALKVMAKRAKEKGLKAFIIKDGMSGDANALARLRSNEIIKGKYSNYNIILAGGETSTKLPKETGKGGRNLHYVGTTMLVMKKYSEEYALVAVNTDGSDYLRGIAGAIIDNNSLISARDKKIDVASYLKKYNSYELMKNIGNSIVITGKTGTNVGDIVVYAL